MEKVLLDPESVVQLNPNYVIRLEYFGGILYDKQHRGYYGLNRTASDILFLTQYSLSLSDIVSLLSRIYELKPSEIMDVVSEFLYPLLTNGVVKKGHKKGNPNNAFNQLEKMRKFVDQLKYLSAPLTAFLYLTWKCNIKCKYCFLKAPRRLLREPLTLEEIKKVIDELSEMRTFELCITGGEPLLDQRLPEVVKYACERGFTVNITTNGLLVNRELAKKLATCNVNVQVPLHSSDFKIHDELTGMPGSFEKAVDTIKLLVNLNMNVSVITILQKANKDDLRNMLPLIKELGVHVWNIVELKPVGRADNSMAIPLKERLKIIEELEREANKLGIQIIAEKPFFFVGDKGLSQTLINDEFYKLFTRCGVRTGRYVEITPDGFVYPCDLLLGDTFPNLIAGDLRQNTFKEIWHSSEILNKFRNLKQEDMHGKCKSCIYFDLCGGKCRALAYSYYDGDLYAPDPRCPYEPK